MVSARLFPYFAALAPLGALLSCQGPVPVEPGEGAGSKLGRDAIGVTVLSCAHDPCVVGSPLSSNCEPCVTTVCAQDPFCCDITWDGICVSEATSLCNGRCDGGGTGGSGGSGGTGGSAGAENTNALCSDKIDNDGDGFIDCKDFDCLKNANVTVCGGSGSTSGTSGTGGSSGTAGTGGTGGSGGEMVRVRIMAGRSSDR